MLKKIENWLRRLIADEVGKVERNLKQDYFNQLKQHVLCEFQVTRLHIREEVRDIITADLKQFRADLVAERLLAAEPQHWKADADVVKEDHELRHPKPARR